MSMRDPSCSRPVSRPRWWRIRLAVLAICHGAGTAGAGVTQQIGPTVQPDISGDGRYVVTSGSVATYGISAPEGVYVTDRHTGLTTPVTTAVAGYPAISSDGRWVTFMSGDASLVPDDTNGLIDVFLHDLVTGTTTRVSVSSSGEEANGTSFPSFVSADGRVVAFASSATNLVPDDTNDAIDVFVHDRDTGETTRVSVDSSGAQTSGLADRRLYALSANGRVVAFSTVEGDLVPNDTNEALDVFIHDQDTGETTRVSVASDGTQAAGVFGIIGSANAALSADGRFV